jgi:hypothetical protein
LTGKGKTTSKLRVAYRAILQRTSCDCSNK